MSDTDKHKDDHEEKLYKEIFMLVMLVMLFCKFNLEAYLEKIKPIIGHNTGVIILVGIGVSYVIYANVS
jgi:hypothetical protein